MEGFVSAPARKDSMFIGKIFGAVSGYLIGDVLLAIFGLFVGHLIDEGIQRLHAPPNPKVVQENFFLSVFSLLGALAKVDGRICEEEIAHTEKLMKQMGLTTEHRREAIKLFKAGAQPGFDVDSCVAEFRTNGGHYVNLVHMLLVYLISIALADDKFHPEEEAMLYRIAKGLGISSASFTQFVRMTQAQDRFASNNKGTTNIATAYAALGVDAADSDSAIKKAYRKLMSEYHPDKLIGQGVPEDMIQAATERSQEIQQAYDLIRKARLASA